MADVRTFIASAKDHAATTTLTGLLSIPSAVFGLLPMVQDFVGIAAAFFAGVAVATLYWVHRKSVLTPQQTTFALGWFSGAVVACLICLISFAKGPPVQATPVAVLQVDPKSPPCMQLVQYGYKCSEEDFATALRTNNEGAIKLFVKAGQRLNPEQNMAPVKAWGVYADAMISEGRRDELFKCDEGLSAYGCAALASVGNAPVGRFLCAIKSKFPNDPTLAAYLRAEREKEAKAAAKQFDEVSNAECNGTLDYISIIPTDDNQRLDLMMRSSDGCRWSSDPECRSNTQKLSCESLKAGWLKDAGRREAYIAGEAKKAVDRIEETGSSCDKIKEDTF